MEIKYERITSDTVEGKEVDEVVKTFVNVVVRRGSSSDLLYDYRYFLNK